MYGDDDLSLTSMPLVDEKCSRRRADSARAGASLMGSTANSGAEQGEQVGQTVVSDTHVANPRLYLVVGSGPGLQDTSRVVFCDNLPSAAPSARWTESAARHLLDTTTHRASITL